MPGARRIVIPRVGGPDVLRAEPWEPPPPGPGEVTLDVAAVGVNFADLACRLGLYQAAPPIPFTPGLEVAGVASVIGPGVEGLTRGDRVLAVTRFGGYATRMTVRAELCRAFPDAWSFAEAAAFPVVFLTAYHGLVHVGRLASGETLVVQSAAGGVGTAACQLGRLLGARVLGTVGSEGKRRVALDAGADEVVASRDYKVWPAIDALTGDEGVDVVFDAVGGPGLRQGYERLRPGGRLLIYGFADMMPRGGWRNWPLLAWKYLRTPRFTPLTMTTENRTISGLNLIYLWDRIDLFTATMERLVEWAEQGRIRPLVGRTLPFEDVAEAHRLMHARETTGKVVLLVS